jgi:hypothetical protein
MRRLLLFTLVFLAWPGSAFAQLSAYAPPALQGNDPRMRRAMRERAVAYLGTAAARPFVETPYGDEACYAIFNCSLPAARKLAEFHASGELDNLPKPRELLLAIARCGDDAALFAIRNARALQDQDSMDAFLIWPLDIALGLKPLDVATSEVRAGRLSAPAPNQLSINSGPVVFVGLAVVALALVVWFKRRKGMA